MMLSADAKTVSLIIYGVYFALRVPFFLVFLHYCMPFFFIFCTVVWHYCLSFALLCASVFSFLHCWVL